MGYEVFKANAQTKSTEWWPKCDKCGDPFNKIVITKEGHPAKNIKMTIHQDNEDNICVYYTETPGEEPELLLDLKLKRIERKDFCHAAEACYDGIISDVSEASYLYGLKKGDDPEDAGSVGRRKSIVEGSKGRRQSIVEKGRRLAEIQEARVFDEHISDGDAL